MNEDEGVGWPFALLALGVLLFVIAAALTGGM
jgi:hypothetical protein